VNRLPCTPDAESVQICTEDLREADGLQLLGFQRVAVSTGA